MAYSSIIKKKKICVSCGSECYWFSKKRCQSCSKREDFKPLKKVSDKGKEKREEKKGLIELDKAFYMEVWNASPHFCYECGKKLSNPPSMSYFHHVLEKRNFPQFRHTPENIAILCWHCHQQVEIFIDKAPRTRDLTEKIRNILLNER